MTDLSDTPAGMISRLDASLQRRGQAVTLRRYAGQPRVAADRPMTGHVRAVSADEIVGDITQTSSKAILSPTGIGDMWPVKETDKLVIQGKERDIKIVKPFFVADVLVRCELMVDG